MCILGIIAIGSFIIKCTYHYEAALASAHTKQQSSKGTLATATPAPRAPAIPHCNLLPCQTLEPSKAAARAVRKYGWQHLQPTGRARYIGCECPDSLTRGSSQGRATGARWTFTDFHGGRSEDILHTPVAGIDGGVHLKARTPAARKVERP